MQPLDNNTKAFIELVKAGLFEKGPIAFHFGEADYGKVMRLAEEQSVVGLVTAGMERVEDAKMQQKWTLQFIGSTLQIEQRNKAMNDFIAELVERMRKNGIYAVLVKGQGVAQCYERPIWRSSGDIDLLLSEDNYNKSKNFLLPLSSSNKAEGVYSKHLGMNIGQWYLELHGSLRSGLSTRLDKEIDKVQRDVFYGGKVRSWMNGNTQVFLPGADEDVFFVFTHFVRHFYKEGVGLRQICDWVRLLWTYKDSLNHRLLNQRIKNAGLMLEWKVFATLSMEYLGMPAEAIPLFDNGKCSKSIKRKAAIILEIILTGRTGNKVKDTWRIAKVFPHNTIKFLPGILLNVNALKLSEIIKKSHYDAY